EEGAHKVAVSTELTEELIAEGLAREIVRRVQTMRQKANLNIADHITVYYDAPELVRKAVERFAPYIKQETLSLDLAAGPAPQGSHSATEKISGHQVSLGIIRASGAGK
ncbi:MAG: DUF5915 domain-containing protein, partial [Chloroflexota bacterium]